MITLYSMQPSGNCYKLRLVMAQLQIPFQIEDIDTLQQETHRPEFLAKNPYGKVPLLQLADGRYLPESNAGLCYLARDTQLLPDEPFDQAQVLQWLFWEQYSHEPNIAKARFWWALKPGGRTEMADRFPLWWAAGNKALALMNDHLQTHDFIAAGRYTIADIALYAYSHVAEEGGFDLAAYPAVQNWLQRVSEQPGHVDLNWRPSLK